MVIGATFVQALVALVEDTPVRGHHSWVTSEIDALTVVVQLPD